MLEACQARVLKLCQLSYPSAAISWYDKFLHLLRRIDDDIAERGEPLLLSLLSAGAGDKDKISEKKKGTTSFE